MMPRKPRLLLPGYSYHITCRCNNREFRLTRLECRQVFLFIALEAKVRTLLNAEIQSGITSDFLLTRSAILRLLYSEKGFG